MITFEGNKFLVSRADGVAGSAVAMQLSQLGAKLVLAGLDQGKLDACHTALSGSGHVSIRHDGGDSGKLQASIDQIMEKQPEKFDGYVHAVELADEALASGMDAISFERLNSINTRTYLEMIRKLSGKGYAKDGMAVLHLSVSHQPGSGTDRPTFCWSAAGLSRSLSLEYLERRFRINSLVVESFNPSTQDATEDSDGYDFVEARDVSSMAAFMLSDSARFIVGETWHLEPCSSQSD